MLPDKILAERNRIKQLGKECLKKYLIPENSYQHFVLVAVPFLYDEFMMIAGEMSGEELSEGNWWNDGFKSKREISSQTLRHEGIVGLCNEMAYEIYASK